VGLGEGLARSLDAAVEGGCRGLFGEHGRQFVGPCGLGLGVLLMRLRALEGGLGLRLGLRDRLNEFERQDHLLERRVGLGEIAPA